MIYLLWISLIPSFYIYVASLYTIAIFDPVIRVSSNVGYNSIASGRSNVQLQARNSLSMLQVFIVISEQVFERKGSAFVGPFTF